MTMIDHVYFNKAGLHPKVESGKHLSTLLLWVTFGQEILSKTRTHPPSVANPLQWPILHTLHTPVLEKSKHFLAFGKPNANCHDWGWLFRTHQNADSSDALWHHSNILQRGNSDKVDPSGAPTTSKRSIQSTILLGLQSLGLAGTKSGLLLRLSSDVSSDVSSNRYDPLISLNYPRKMDDTPTIPIVFLPERQAPCQKWASFSLSVRLIGQASPLCGLICWDIPKNIIPIDRRPSKYQKRGKGWNNSANIHKMVFACYLICSTSPGGGPRYRL